MFLGIVNSPCRYGLITMIFGVLMFLVRLLLLKNMSFLPMFDDRTRDVRNDKSRVYQKGMRSSDAESNFIAQAINRDLNRQILTELEQN